MFVNVRLVLFPAGTRLARVHVTYAATAVFRHLMCSCDSALLIKHFLSIFFLCVCDATVQVKESKGLSWWAEPRRHFPSLSCLHCCPISCVVCHLAADPGFFVFCVLLRFCLTCCFDTHDAALAQWGKHHAIAGCTTCKVM